jgi:hypothetical protein
VIATTRVDVYTGTTTDLFGDPAPDNTTPSGTGVPVALTEYTANVNEGGTSGTPRSVSGGALLYVPTPGNKALFVEGARVYDTKTGVWWTVDGNQLLSSPMGVQDGKASLRKVAA